MTRNVHDSTPSPPPHPSGEEYILGTSRAELERLGLQHRLWADAAHTLWRQAGLKPGSRVLDIGCGPGFAAFDMAQIVGAPCPDSPPGELVGVDESRPYLDHLLHGCKARALTNVRAVLSNVIDLESIPEVPSTYFDAAYARWVFCFVPDPAAVVRGVHKALQPGGRLMVQDYFNYESMSVAPRKASFTKAVKAVGDSWRSRGGDPDIVGRLTGLLETSGFTVEHLAAHQRLARPHEQMWHWPDSFWRNFLPVLVSLGHLTQDDQSEFMRDWEETARTPGAFAFLPPVFDIIAVKRDP